MKEMNSEELLAINGGVNITGTLINGLIKGMNTVLDIGRSIGTAIRRAITGNICPVK